MLGSRSVTQRGDELRYYIFNPPVNEDVAQTANGGILIHVDRDDHPGLFHSSPVLDGA